MENEEIYEVLPDEELIFDFEEETDSLEMEEVNEEISETNEVSEEQPTVTDEQIINAINELITENINSDENSEGEEGVVTGSEEVGSSENEVDLQPVLESIDAVLKSQNVTNDSLDVYVDNNAFDSSIENISLTNGLLLTIIVVLLFNGVIEFARRIL